MARQHGRSRNARTVEAVECDYLSRFSPHERRLRCRSLAVRRGGAVLGSARTTTHNERPKAPQSEAADQLMAMCGCLDACGRASAGAHLVCRPRRPNDDCTPHKQQPIAAACASEQTHACAGFMYISIMKLYDVRAPCFDGRGDEESVHLCQGFADKKRRMTRAAALRVNASLGSFRCLCSVGALSCAGRRQAE